MFGPDSFNDGSIRGFDSKAVAPELCRPLHSVLSRLPYLHLLCARLGPGALDVTVLSAVQGILVVGRGFFPALHLLRQLEKAAHWAASLSMRRREIIRLRLQ